MTVPRPAQVGARLEEIDTPSLIIDLDAFERNVRRMADAAARFGVRLRAHSKTHKSPIIARRQMTHGAVGVCCQKVSEAEVMVAGGIDNVLVSNEVVGAYKVARLAALARQARIGVCVDDEAQVVTLGEGAEHFGARIHALVEIDVGAGRCGLEPGDRAVALAKAVTAQPSLRFEGLQAYHGSAQHIRDYAARRDAIQRAGALTAETVELLLQAGLTCETIGGGGTGTFEFEAESNIWNEIQAGSYVFMDADYARNCNDEGSSFAVFEHALFVLATVMSRPREKHAVVDAGLKALAFDSGLPNVWTASGVTYKSASDEHGVLEVGGSKEALALGDRVCLVPGHCDPTVNLHDWYVCVRDLGSDDAYVEAIWPIAARGCLF